MKLQRAFDSSSSLILTNTSLFIAMAMTLGVSIVDAAPSPATNATTGGWLDPSYVQQMADLGFIVTSGQLSKEATDAIDFRAAKRKRNVATSPNPSTLSARFQASGAICARCEGSGSFAKYDEVRAFHFALLNAPNLLNPVQRGGYYTVQHGTLFMRIMAGNDLPVGMVAPTHAMLSKVTEFNLYACPYTYDTSAFPIWQWPSWTYDLDNRPLEFCLLGENKCWNDRDGYCRL